MTKIEFARDQHNEVVLGISYGQQNLFTCVTCREQNCKSATRCNECSQSSRAQPNENNFASRDRGVIPFSVGFPNEPKENQLGETRTIRRLDPRCNECSGQVTVNAISRRFYILSYSQCAHSRTYIFFISLSLSLSL